MKRLSFLWLLLLATCSVSFANTYSDEDQWSYWGSVGREGYYLNLFLQDSVYYGVNNNDLSAASVSFYWRSCSDLSPTIHQQSSRLLLQKNNRKPMPQGCSIYRRFYAIKNAIIRPYVILENKTIPITRIEGSAFADSPNLTSISIPSSITFIGEEAFRNCQKLSSIAIPNSVDSIRAYTFQGCTNLTSVTIGSGVKYIGGYAFSGTGLTSITIPDNVRSIGSQAFADCKDLTTITLTSTTPPTINYSFSNCSNLKAVYIPCGTKEAYEAAGWRNLPLTEPAPDGIVSVETEDNVKGQVKIEDQSTCRNNSTAIISATAQYGYHFTKWNDGNTDNPRTIILTCDTTLTAEFAPNQYTISTEVNDVERGSVSGGTTADYLSKVTLTATANYGYHFARWQDWNTNNPRTVQVKGDATYSAVFEKNTYTITAQSANDIQGYVSAPYQAEYLDQVSLIAYPNVGYHFTQWTDGNTDNPRTIVLTCDTTFTAEFAQTFSGQCGDNLYWKYEGHTLTISGTGNMYDYNDYDMPWFLFRDTTDVVILERGIAHIGNNAFNGCVNLSKIELPNTLTSIGAYAFAGCRKLVDVYAYSTEPPIAEQSSFANYNVYVHIPCDNLRAYQMDAVFGTFKYVRCISADSANADDMTIIPSDTEATITWPTEENAGAYTITITKDGIVFCTLLFNANGQLTNIAFAPGRNTRPHSPAAQKTATGYLFTVTGLSKSTHYACQLDVKDTSDEVVKNYSAEFTTTSGTTAVDEVEVSVPVFKIIRNGQVYIRRGDKIYTVMGQCVIDD